MASGSETRQRQNSLRVRLTDAERTALDGAAERAGLSLASYARQVLLAAPPPRQARRPPVEKAELGRLVAQIGKIGSN
ncbi:MAG: plasmid mobilization relaxosome protein MobC, partial [Alphaproteobacteria bacterium]|nr:plasmid mobilization relaxosome protein MobC [Alphaproteobacteria bacterium]